MLGIERIGAYDNFFELGGHSLLLPQILNGLRQAFQIELPVHQLFEHTTVVGLARVYRERRRAADCRREQPIAERIRAAFPTERQAWSRAMRQKIALALGLAADPLPADGHLTEFDRRRCTRSICWSH